MRQVLTLSSEAKTSSGGIHLGTVLKNVAMKMYSRGMLNNSSDFHGDARPDPEFYTFRSLAPAYRRLRESFDIPRVKHFATADKQSDGLPSVIGYSCAGPSTGLKKPARKITFSGTGVRHSADPIAGTYTCLRDTVASYSRTIRPDNNDVSPFLNFHI